MNADKGLQCIVALGWVAVFVTTPMELAIFYFAVYGALRLSIADEHPIIALACFCFFAFAATYLHAIS